MLILDHQTNRRSGCAERLAAALDDAVIVSLDGLSIEVRGKAPPRLSDTELVGWAGLQELWRELRSDHVLVLGPGSDVDADALTLMTTALASDSACASISCLPAGRRTGWVADCPPPGVERPSGPTVLVAGAAADLVLAIADRPDLRAALVGPSDLATMFLAALEMPGLIHRAVVSPVVVTKGESRQSSRRAQPADIVIDASCLRSPLTGTQLQTLCLLGGLADRADVRVEALVPRVVHPTCQELIPRLCPSVRFVETRSSPGGPTVVHRPFQVDSFERLRQLAELGDRLVITHQDMILDRTPTYAGSNEAWAHFSRVTAAAMSVADHVGFFSRHAARDAASEGYIGIERTSVVPLGLDHLHEPTTEQLPPGLAASRGRPFILVVGNAYAHKNRVWAISLVHRLADTGWDGMLVLAGGHPVVGSSIDAEQRLLDTRPDHSDRVLDLGSVSEAEKAWLYRNAALALFPSLYEGFGFVPFEAAAVGTPALYFHRSAMEEFLPAEGSIPTFELEGAARFVHAILSDATQRQAIVAAIDAAAEELTWGRTAEGYAEAYRRVLDQPPRTMLRELVVGLPGRSALGRLSRQETRVIDVHRRHRNFGRALDATVAAGGLVFRSLSRRSSTDRARTQ